MRTLHTGETYQHENGSSIVIVSPIYVSLSLPPIRYRVKKVDGQKEFTYSKEEMQDLINQGKLKRTY